MENTSLCALILLLLKPLCSEQAQDAVLTFNPSWPSFFTGESVTMTCEMNEGEETDWKYKFITKSWHFVSPSSRKNYTLSSLETVFSGEYQCCGRQRSPDKLKCSKTVFLGVSDKPRARLSAGPTTIPAGGNVTLSCSVDGSATWRYQWFRRTSDSSEVLTGDEQSSHLTVTQGGIYRCRGERGDPAVPTHSSGKVRVQITYSNKVLVKQQPDRPEVFSGETVALTCEVQGGETTEWKCSWRRSGSVIHHTQSKHWTFSVSESSSGSYMCQCERTDDPDSSTAWSEAVTLSVSNRPQSVLSVSPSWLSPGASVTLSCELQPPSAGWRFFWYQAVPELPGDSYNYKLLPGRTNGTEQNSFMVDGQKHTAGYVCRAGRGEPVIYTDYSQPKFVWSADVHPAASLTVSPDRVQHFTSDSVSLSCEGTSTEWRVRRFEQTGEPSELYCFREESKTGSSCQIHRLWSYNSVFCCEFGSGEFSNAVNITVQSDYSDNLILVSPVRPVTEGDPVTLSCMKKRRKIHSNVSFYHNDKLLQSDSRGELNISAVSKSDEGFYKCQHSGKESPQSWMSVKVSESSPVSSSSPVLLIVGAVIGITVILLLLLLWRYRQSKDLCCIRPESRTQSSTTDHRVEQTQDHVYSFLIHGDVSPYESIQPPGATGNERPRGSKEGADYVNVKNVKTRAAVCADITYQNNCFFG